MDNVDYALMKEADLGRSTLIKNGTTISGRFALEMLTLAQKARVVLNSHMCFLSYLPSLDYHEAVHAVSLSKKYERFKDFNVQPTGEGLWTIVCKEKGPIRLTAKEILDHQDFNNFGHMADDEGTSHPPLEGWLACSIRSKGNLLGILQVSDKFNSKFSNIDEIIIKSIADMIAICFNEYSHKMDITGKLEKIAQTILLE